MAKVIIGIMVLGSLLLADTWTCYRYVDGSPTGGFVKVQASNKQEAEQKSLKKYKKLGYKVDYTKCK